MTIHRKKIAKGIRISKENIEGGAGAEDLTLDGEIGIDANDNEVKVRLNGSTETVVTEDQTQTVTNKTIDSASNTITIDADEATVSELEVDNLKAGVLDTDLSSVSASDDTIPSAKATKAYVDAQILTKDDASEITYTPSTLTDWDSDSDPGNVDGGLDQLASRVDASEIAVSDHIADTVDAHEGTAVGYDPTSSGLSAINSQDAIDEVESRLDTAETGISDHLSDATDAHDASAISNVPAGNLAATDIQGAVDELQSDIDTRALSGDLNTHKTAAGDHTAAVITNVPAGNLAAVTVQAALDELQTDVDTRGLASDLTTHESDTSTHGVTTVAGISEAQVITNKDIDGGTAANTRRITLPKNTKTNLDGLTRKQGTLVYDTTADKVYKDNGTDLVEIGGAGQGGINYILNPDAELNTDGWNLYDNTVADELPEDGTGGTPSIGFSRVTVNPLRGDASFSMVAPAINNQGGGVSYDFTVDNADLAKKLIISFDYKAEASYVDDLVRVYIYDVTNSNLIRVNGEDIKAGTGTHYAQFQTASDSNEYRLIIHIAQTDAVGYSLILDNVSVGPQVITHGTIVTDSEDHVPSTDPTNSTVRWAKYHRHGQFIDISIRWDVTGTPGTPVFDDVLPSGLSVDLDALHNSDVGGERGRLSVGEWQWSDVGTNTYTGVVAFRPDSGQLTMRSGVGSSLPVVTSGDAFGYELKNIPIQGWSSNSKLSEDFSGRDVIARAELSGTQTVTSTGITLVEFAEVIRDTTSSYDGTTNYRFTAPETGDYLVSAQALFGSLITELYYMYLYKNGAAAVKRGSYFTAVGTASIDTTISLEKSDYIDIRVKSTTDTSYTLTDSTDASFFAVTKLASAQTILENETVAARYTSNAGAAVSTGAPFIFEDLVTDTHNMYNSSTGIGIIPVSGHYLITAKAQVSSTSGGMTIEINGTVVSYTFIDSQTNAQPVVSDAIYLEKGDTFEIVNPIGSRTMITTLGLNVFSIARIK